MQAWQHAEDMKKKIVSNAMCSWAEAVALSAGEEIDFDRTSCSLATVEAFVQLRQVLWCFFKVADITKSFCAQWDQKQALKFILKKS